MSPHLSITARASAGFFSAFGNSVKIKKACDITLLFFDKLYPDVEGVFFNKDHKQKARYHGHNLNHRVFKELNSLIFLIEVEGRKGTFQFLEKRERIRLAYFVSEVKNMISRMHLFWLPGL